MNKNIYPLLVSPLPPPAGGISSWTERLINYCKINHINIAVTNTALIGKRAENVSNKRCFFTEIRRCFRIWNDIKKKIKLLKINIGHINTNCSPSGLIRDYYSCKIFLKNNIRYIVHCRCNIEDQILNNKIALYFFKKICKKASLIFVQNKFSFNFMKNNGFNNVEIIPNFIDENLIKQRNTINKDIKEIVFTGHIKQSKGLREILNSAKCNPEITFKLIGPISEPTLLENIPNVLYLGSKSKDEIFEYLDKADLFLFPTYTEGFSNSLLEAMARGTPIITTNVGANYDMIETNGGVIVPIKSVCEINKAIKMLQDSNIRKKMSNWNTNKVLYHYTIKNVVDKIWDFYEGVINEVY